jgi:hypothetical protein
MTELLVERFERCGWVEGFGVLRFAQDDSKNKQRQKQMQEQGHGKNKKKNNGKNKNNSKNNGKGNSNGNGNGNGERGDKASALQRWILLGSLDLAVA